jgi:hypothetical protein
MRLRTTSRCPAEQACQARACRCIAGGGLYRVPAHKPGAPNGTSGSDGASVGPNTNFVLGGLRETGEIVAAALGDQRRRELRTAGAAMSIDEAIAYALANINPKLLTGPVTFG